VIKSHGGADAEGFAAAIDMGYDMVRYELLAKIGQSMARDMQVSAAVRVASSGAAS
jgi:phosphate acyltransferase